MIRDVNFFLGGGMGAKGAGTWWCHFGYPNNLAGADPGETLLNLLGLLLHLPVNEHCCWRYPCVPCHEASRQHLHLTLWPQRKMAAALTDVFTVLGREPWETCTVRGPRIYRRQQLPQHVSASVYIQCARKTRSQLFSLKQHSVTKQRQFNI